MSTNFAVVTRGPANELATLFTEPSEQAERIMTMAGGHLQIVPSEAENEGWVFVDYFRRKLQPPKRGWTRSWVVGEPREAAPMAVALNSFVMAAARNEYYSREAGLKTPRAEYALALALIENDCEDAPPPLAFDTVWTFDKKRTDPDAVGPFGITTGEWSDFLQSEGAEFAALLPFKRAFPLLQLRCIESLTRRDWEAIARANGDPTGNEHVPRRLDLFIARLVGVPTAVEIAKREAAGAGLEEPITGVLQAVDGVLPTSDATNALLERRKRFMMNEAEATSVKTFIDRARAALDAGLSAGFDMLQFYVPAFANVTTGDTPGTWMAVADAELAEWNAGSWTEKADPGQERVRKYFEATDFGRPQVDTTGEITDWCGAFVAHCLKEAGAPVIKEAARAANWLSWGDASLPPRHGSDVPRGAVVVVKPADPRKNSGHVCFFHEWVGDGRRFLVLGGNQGDRLSIDERNIEDVMDIRVIASRSKASDADLMVLAKTLYGEIREAVDDNPERVENVGHVIINRFFDGYRSNGSIAGVCLFDKQFSCWNEGTEARRALDALPTDGSDATLNKLTVIARRLVERRLGGEPPLDKLIGVRHYYSPAAMRPAGSKPNWAIGREPVHDDGRHKFFRGVP